MELKQRVNLTGWISYSFSNSGQLTVSYKSLTKVVQRNIDVRSLNPNPTEERILQIRKGVSGILFAIGAVFFFCVPAPATRSGPGSVMPFVVIGLIFLFAATSLLYRAYLGSRHIKAFINGFTGRAEVVLYLRPAEMMQVDAFITELHNRIVAAQSRPPLPPAEPKLVN